jgi:hypothetical protein
VIRRHLSNIGWVLKQLISVLWHGLPIVFFFVVWVLGCTAKTSTVGIIAAVMGVPETAGKMADDWKNRSLKAGFPSLWDRQLRFCLEVLACATIFAGWSVTPFTIYLVIDWMFRR